MTNINNKDLMLKSSYNYLLPQELIAQVPVEPRDSSRLLVYNRKLDTIEHKHFYDIIDYLQKGDVLVVNNTRVLPARLFGYKDTGYPFGLRGGHAVSFLPVSIGLPNRQK